MKLKSLEARIETTNLCNAQCLYCARDKMTRPKMIMSYKHFEYLVKQCKKLGIKTISLFGFGEPFIDERMVEKTELCTKLGLDTFITTNASLLHPSLAFHMLKAGLKHIRFSVHGVMSKDYSLAHKGLDQDTVMRNIFNFIVINKKRFDHSCKISISCIAPKPDDEESLNYIIEFWESRVDWLEVWKPHNWAIAKDFRDSTRKRLKTCGRPINGPLQIQADGSVIPCCFLTNSEVILGDTYSRSLSQILTGTKFERFRDAHRNNALEYLPCRDCDQRYVLDYNPLLYSSRDPQRRLYRTSSIKHEVKCETC